MKEKISIALITYNEAKIIKQCLEKLHWADEILVVDSGSTDDTVAICETMGAKVIYHAFENFGVQKQFAIDHTKNDWVLSLDADEVLSDALITEIKNLNLNENCKGYYIPRTHVFLNTIFKYGSEHKKPILRFFNKKYGKFTPNKVHETIVVDGKINYLKNEMLHYTVFDFTIAIQKQVKYALLSGELFFEKNKKSNLIKILFKFPFDFLKVYLLQRNFLNGYQGFTWSMFSAFSSYLKYAYLKELHQNKS